MEDGYGQLPYPEEGFDGMRDPEEGFEGMRDQDGGFEGLRRPYFTEDNEFGPSYAEGAFRAMEQPQDIEDEADGEEDEQEEQPQVKLHGQIDILFMGGSLHRLIRHDTDHDTSPQIRYIEPMLF